MSKKHLQTKTPEARILHLERELNWALMKIRTLEEELRRERIRRMGLHSEKLSDLQLELLQFEPLVTADEVEAEAGRSPFPEPAAETLESQRILNGMESSGGTDERSESAGLTRAARTIGRTAVFRIRFSACLNFKKSAPNEREAYIFLAGV